MGAARYLVAGLASLALGACSLTSLDGFTSAERPAEAGSPEAAIEEGDASFVARSCAELHTARPSLPSGRYTLAPDGSGSFDAYCDMTLDQGGWMLVTPAMITSQTNDLVTVRSSTDPNGGFIQRYYVNVVGCGAGSPTSRHELRIADRPPWTRIRFRQSFAGSASCWAIFGGVDPGPNARSNLRPITAQFDVIRDQVKMGGANGDAFQIRGSRCDDEPGNFWTGSNAAAGTRSATVILTRASVDIAAGLATSGGCAQYAEGEQSPTYWEYDSVYVR